jgi:hypothetical protein
MHAWRGGFVLGEVGGFMLREVDSRVEKHGLGRGDAQEIKIL